MSKRVSHGADRKRSQSLSARRADSSLLDPWIGPALKSVYHVLPIPRWFPPEGIVLTGHLLALAGAVGFAYSTSAWWGGLLLALGVVGNHTADCIDGTHARSTDQCRNGGELLDHFTDPLSFSYWMAGWGIACDRLDLGIAAVICIYATAVLTSIKAKMMGEFTLASFGPTEFKTLLAIFGLVMAALVAG
ncbi:MAG: CDP-alcohol phosphatidyltransferase family protein, partial [Pirellulaceae bacterium]|nr:CDP-alcohol phosphatidyltransferase family protein [Pirellulaceae bacterium]